MKKVIYSIGLIVLLASCAEQRKVVKFADGDAEVLQKDVFVKNYSEKEISQKGLLGSGNIWFSKVTVVKTSGNGGVAMAGRQGDMKAGRFEFSKEQLRFVNVNSINMGDDSVESELLASWSIQHFETRLTEVDGRPTNREEEDNFKSWQQKRSFKIDWADTDVTEGVDFSFSDSFTKIYRCWTKKASQVVDGSREISEDYIGFTVAVDYVLDRRCLNVRKYLRDDSTFTAHYKFSFVKAKQSNYQPMVYEQGETDPLMKQYGYFQTILEQKADKAAGDIYPQKVAIMANRWHPNKTHTFYFAKDYPEKWKWLFSHRKRGIFAKTNALFKRHGLNNYDAKSNTCTTGLCFEIKENDGTKEFGDLRYSFIKIVDENDPGAPLGYGPSDANPFTGEIIAANTILWTSHLEFMVARLADDLDREVDDAHFQKSTLIAQMARSLGTESSLEKDQYRNAWTVTSSRLRKTDSAMDAYFTILPEFTYGYPGWSRFTSRPVPSLSSEGELGEVVLPRIVFPKRLADMTGEEPGPSMFQPHSELLEFKHMLLDQDKLDSLGRLSGGLAGPHGKHEEMLSAFSNESRRVSDILKVGGGFDRFKDLLSSADFAQTFETIKEYFGEFERGHDHQGNSTVYRGVPHLLDAQNMLLSGRTPEEAIDTIMYRVSIHEFGHNLSLRHNFYGSVDHRHFREPFDQKVTIDGETKTIKRVATTTSVMEYQNIRDEFTQDETWEIYDEAALVYAYSDGKIDLSKINNTNYLFCTDEHRVLNALCNTWDSGTTPSEIALRMVEDYDLMYKVLNQRYDRPYWDTRGYASRILRTMHSMKKFLGLYTTSMLSFELQEKLGEAKAFESEDIDILATRIRDDVGQANKIAVAFYDAVLNIKQSEKDYETEYDPWTTEVTRIGIAQDKLFAMYFLMSDDPLLYNPNRYRPYSSYVELAEGSQLSPVIDKVMENIFTARLDMRPGFSGFGRVLFALNAYNFFNREDTRLLDRIKVDCFTAERLKSELGVDPSRTDKSGNREERGWDVMKLSLSQVHKDSDYQDIAGTGERVGLVKIDNNFYVSREIKNKYAFKFIEAMIDRSVNSTDSLEPTKAFIRDSYGLYWSMKNSGELPECRSGKL